MAIPVGNPRRRSQKDTVPQSLSSLDTAAAMSLRKSDTFNARDRTLGTLVTPFEVASLMPKRSPTNPKSLEELLAEGENHVEYISKLLSDFNLSWKSNKPLAADASILIDRDVLDAPNFAAPQGRSRPIDIANGKLATSTDHHHDSDSGLGTSIDSSVTGKDDLLNQALLVRQSDTDPYSEKELSARSSTNSTPRASIETPHTSQFFSRDSVRQIKKHIVQPILDEPSLKEFHPLIEDIPRRIGAKFILNLRDLEKTLFFLAPDYASSPSKFLQFCNTSIECLQTTVDLICERDQRKPTDRPYTNNYFVDLVDQIRRYAEIMKHTREKQERGEELDEMDYTPDEEITIQGGLSHNGRPAELIRIKKNGKGIALTDDTMLDDIAEGTSSKRPLTEEDMDEDEIYRSMARRRKSDKAGDVMHECQVCDKEFKRPCDLTKHEKTHSRPWKCPEPKCKYHEMGWPTEKERDRHMNDKHSAAPPMYKCQFPPCTYSSKRESNCKQHMEKAHDWKYVRSKHNGRRKPTEAGGSSSAGTPITPLTPFMATPASHHAQLVTPPTPFAASPFAMNSLQPYGSYGFNNFNTLPPTPSDGSSMFGGRRESAATVASASTRSENYLSPVENTINSFEHVMAQDLFSMDPTANMMAPVQNGTMFQQPTPAMSINNTFSLDSVDYVDFSKASPVPAMSGIPHVDGNMSHISPAGQGNLTLYSPDSGNFDNSFNFEEALGGQASDFGPDFQLYNSPGPGEAGPSNYQTHVSPGGYAETKDVINELFDENGRYIGDDFATPFNNLDVFNF